MLNNINVWLILPLLLNAHILAANQLSPPETLNDGWQVSSLAKEGLNAQQFIDLEQLLAKDKHRDLQSISVFKNNKIVYEKHLNGANQSTITDIRSATKSITSVLIGIAIDKGFINSVDDKILPYFSNYYPIKHLSEHKRNITIRHLLTMSAGFDSEDAVSTSIGNEDNLDALSSDWVRYAIDVPMRHAPGTKWAYSSMNTFLLGYILEKATGQSLDKFAQDTLLTPLGISNVQWRKTPQNRTVAQGNFKISSRDMGKIGQLVLAGGIYNGQQLVSKQWLGQSTQAAFAVPWHNYDSYGFKWYNHKLQINGESIPYVFASGNGGNKIYLIAKFNLVVAITSTAYGKSYGHTRSFTILKKVLESLSARQPQLQ